MCNFGNENFFTFFRLVILFYPKLDILYFLLKSRRPRSGASKNYNSSILETKFYANLKGLYAE